VRTAVIDIGTNTLLLLLVDQTSAPPSGGAARSGEARPCDEQLRRVVDLCRFGRLGKGLDASGKLDPAAIARSLDICTEYRRVIDEHGVGATYAIATQAVREASNARDFVEPAERILGTTIEVIAGKREAELAALSVSRTFPELADAHYLVVDVGGGSTEVIDVDRGMVVSAVSVPIGAVRLTERHLHSDPPTDAELAALSADIKRSLAPLTLPSEVFVVGTAGTATTLAAVELAMTTYDPDRVTGLHVSRERVEDRLVTLARATVAERKTMAGIEPQRADVIVAGIAIYARVLERVDARELITCDRGIRWGLAFERTAAPR
jgi:exopolyphosphatase/guanosine-5'-triphosphate,3'-diphosphate pyrophosphatase